MKTLAPRWRRFSTSLLISGLLLSPAGFVGATNPQTAIGSTLRRSDTVDYRQKSGTLSISQRTNLDTNQLTRAIGSTFTTLLAGNDLRIAGSNVAE